MKINKIKTMGNFFVKYECEIMLFLLILFSNESFLFGVGDNELLVKGKFFVDIFLFLFVFIKFLMKKNSLPKINVLLFLILSFITLLSCVVNNCFDIWTVWRILLLFFSMIIANFYNSKKFTNSYINIIYAISVFSIISYIINMLFPTFFSKFPIVSNYAGYKFHSILGLNYIPLIFSNRYGLRNYSLFREPGVFACYLGIALLFALLGDNVEDNNKIKKIIVLSLAMISTLSTTGIISLLLIILVFLFKKNKNKRLSRMIIALLVVIFGFYINGNFDMVFDKLFNVQSQYATSKTDRFNGIAIASEFISSNPLLGAGITNFDNNSKMLTIYVGNNIISTNHFTISLLKIFAQTGIICFIIYLYGLYNIAKKNCNQKIVYLLSFLILIIIFSNEDFTLNILFHMLIFYGINYRKKEKEAI